MDQPDRPQPALRERRRRQTAREIQRACLALIAQHGLSGVTVDMIADRAGISLRSFYNYYTHKEAAAVGHPPEFSQADLAAFAAGQGALHDDLLRLLQGQLGVLWDDFDLIAQMPRIVRDNPSLQTLLHDRLQAHRDTLAVAVAARFAGMAPADADLLADVVLTAIRHTIHRWLDGSPETPAAAAARTLASLRRIGGVMAAL